MRPDATYSYVRDLLESMTGSRPVPDHDGDLPVTYEGASFYVRVLGSVDAWIQVFCVALSDIEPSSELFADLNSINTQLRFARVFHVQTQILIETELWSDDLNPGNFQHACGNVASAADAFGRRLQESFGGRLVFEESKTLEYEQLASQSNLAGPYL